MNPIILIGCFTPLVIIFIVMKLAVWIDAVNAEQDYVRKEPLRKRGPYLENPYADVDEMRKKRNMEIAQTIDEALEEYYSEIGRPVPQWKRQKDPDWWRDYLISLGIDPGNP